MLSCKRCLVVLWLSSCWLPVAVAQDKPAVPKDAGVPVIDWKDATKHLDEEVIVQGRIVQTKNIGRMCFLNFDTARTFTAVVREDNYKNFPQPPEKMYDNKVVRIRGLISEYKGKPEIEVSRPEHVTILDQPEPIPPASQPTSRPFAGVVTVGTFNTLNMLDEYDDPYRLDEGTPAKPKAELEGLAAAMRAADADVLALQEVENRDFLERFVAAQLGDMGYKHVVCFEGNDRRGIDCALLSRLPVGPVTSYRHLRFPDSRGEEMWFRRDLLQVQIEPPACPPFLIFVAHFKSKRGDAAGSEKYRLGEARQGRAILDGLLKRDPEALFMICGDFNDTWDSAPMKALRGAGPGALRDFLSDLPKDACTYNKKPYGMIDFILCSPAMAQRYQDHSYRVLPGSVPTQGSDHNPVLARFDMGSRR